MHRGNRGSLGCMSRPLRLEFPGSLNHITSRGNARQAIFFNDEDRETFLHFLGLCVDRFDWILTAYVLMSNHFHLVVQLTSETLSRGLQWLNSKYSQTFNRSHERIGHLLQGRPSIRLIDHEQYSREVLRYVVLNPVRAKMVAHPEDYKWSSHRAVLGLAPAPKWLAVDDVLIQFAPERDLARAYYCEYVNAAIGSRESPWSRLVGQIYLGREAWIDEVRERVQLSPRSSDIPRAQRFLPAADMATIIRLVAAAFSVEESQIRFGRNSLVRAVTAWIAWHDGQLTATEIAAGLRLRCAGHVSRLVNRCERELENRTDLREMIDACSPRNVDKSRRKA